MPPYMKTVFYSQEDCGYIADAPDLEYCSAFGETPEEALEELERAMQAWLQTSKENGRPIPLPSRMRFATSNISPNFHIKEKASDQPAQMTVNQEYVYA
jgi:predicted RNase H-like HicB family nuclease